jgi:hypothetical protein
MLMAFSPVPAFHRHETPPHLPELVIVASRPDFIVVIREKYVFRSHHADLNDGRSLQAPVNGHISIAAA